MSNTFQNFSIRTKLKLMALAIVGLTAALGLYGYLLLDGNARKTAELQTGVISRDDIVSDFHDAATLSIAELYRLTSTASSESDTTKIEALAKDVTKELVKLDNGLGGIKVAMAKEGYSSDQVKTFADLVTAYTKRGKDVTDMVAADVATATGMMTGTRQRYAALRNNLDQAVAALSKHKADSLTTIAADMRQGEMVFAISLAVIIATALGLSFVMGSIIATPMTAITDVVESLSRGNLSIAVQDDGRTDEVGKLTTATIRLRDQLADAEKSKEQQVETIVGSVGAGLSALAMGDLTARINVNLAGPFAKLKSDFNAAMEQLQSTMKSVLVSTGGITTGAGEIAQATDDLSRRTEQQAATLEQTAAAMEEITTSVKSTATNIRAANDSAMAAKSAAEEGGKVVGIAVGAMDEIAQSSKKITDIIGVIDEIAFQTNLLALNAGVEAARAGDAGRGFAVVASEVRALAGRSSEAAKQIKTLISASGEQVAAGVKHVGDTGQALNRIVEQILRINSLVSQISAAAEQQSHGIGEVNAAIGQMDQVTQQNAAMVEESTAAARSLAHETEALRDLVAFFAVGDSAASRGDTKLRVVARARA
jgi:methyl-accepting chemotaxis protein